MKKGYLAEENQPPTDAKLKDLLREAIWSPLDSTKLSVSTRIDPSSIKPKASRLTFALDPNELDFHLNDGKYHGQVDFIFVQEKKRGAAVADQKRTASIALPPNRLKDILENGMAFSDDISLTPDTVAIRVPCARPRHWQRRLCHRAYWRTR